MLNDDVGFANFRAKGHNASMALNRELEGLLVVSMEQAVAAPYCGLLLADAGARVIKVERPEGDFARLYDKGADGHSVFFAWLNRGKQSIAIDLNDESDGQLMRALLRKADIFLSNLAPGALERRGFGWTELSKTNPGLISCSISGYGREGGNKKAYDFLVQGRKRFVFGHRHRRTTFACWRFHGRHFNRAHSLLSDIARADPARPHRQGDRY